MSGVELPLVPSARASSSSSSASSRTLMSSSRSRGTLHSASSTASYRSERQRPSLYDDDEDEDAPYNENEGEEDDGDHDDETNSDDGDELPQAPSQSSSSSGLWDQVEVFLNKPPPDFAQLTKDTDAKLHAVSKTLPTLPRGSDRKPTAPTSGSSSSSSNNNNSSSNQRALRPTRLVSQGSGKGLSKPIDPHLLQQAFAYAERIQQMSFDDDEGDQDQQQQQQQVDAHRARVPVGRLRPDATGPRMPSELVKEPSGSMPRGGKVESSADRANAPKKKTKKSALVTERSAYGAAVKPSKRKSSESRAREREPAAAAGWDSSKEPIEPRKPSSASGSGLDQQTIQSLVSSLQNGTTVDELRRELAASQQSLAYSRQVIQDAAKSFFTHKR